MPFELYYVLYLVLGAFAGVIAGMLGVGGGLIIVPVLASIYAAESMPGDIIMHLALGTSLATIVFTSISSVYAHHKHQAVLWSVFWRLTPGILIGAWLGGWLAGQLSTQWLSPLFACFELLVAFQLLTGKQVNSHRQLPNNLGVGLASGVIGHISAVVGIGGGTMTVPYLLWNNIALRKAIATSAACGLPIAIAGSLSYVFTGWQHSSLPVNTLGFVHLPAFFCIIITSTLCAPIGARLAHHLPVPVLKKFFAIFLIVLAVKLLLNEF